VPAQVLASPPKATMSRSRGDVAQHRVSQMHVCDGAPLRFVRLCPPCTGVDRAGGSGEIAGGLHFLRWYDCARTGQSGSDCRGEQLGAGQMPQYGRQRQWHRRSGASRRPAGEPVVLVGSSRGHWTRGRVLVSRSSCSLPGSHAGASRCRAHTDLEPRSFGPSERRSMRLCRFKA
jgi:hypothetical protein